MREQLPAVRIEAGAFTLVELLVVISIIALLSGLVVPTLVGLKDLPKDAICQSNQRALGVAILTRSRERGGCPPSSEAWIQDVYHCYASRPPENSFDWNRETMHPALFCPMDTDPYPRPYMGGKIEATSYFVNGAATDFAMGGGRAIGVGLFGGEYSLDSIPNASACMMIGETTNYGKVVDLDHPAVQAAFTKAGASVAAARTRFHHRATSGFFHRGRMSVLFADGHAEMVPGRRVEPLDPALWPGGPQMDAGTTFFPTLSLPSAAESPEFWGPGYVN